MNYVGNTSGTLDSSFEYTYDDRGNICGIIEEYDVKGNRTVVRIGGLYTRGYIYDAFGEVVKAKESYKSGQSKTYYYTYDDGGNITDEFINDPDANDVIQNRYEYDPVWKDQLKKYSGKTIDYDKCGNPTQYLGYHMDWDTTNGSLTFVNANGKDCNYTYLSDGQRISKDVGGEKTAYIYNAGMLLYEETKDYRLNFYYDADGLVTEIGYQTKDNGRYSDETRYFYSRNGQGDIIAIYRCKDSTLVGTYEYDLWGNPVSQNENIFTKKVNGKTVTITDEQGILGKNPLRYRGYYFDKETGFYYLNARYYDPVVHRFISAEPNHKFCKYDKNLGINAYNLYTYCGNDPVNLSDQTGEFIITTTMICVGICAAVGMAIGGIYGDIKANEKGYTGWDKARTILTWIGIGGLIGAGIGAALGPLVTYLTGFAGLSVTSAGVSTLSVIEFPELFHQCFSLPKVLEHMCRPAHHLEFLGDTADEIYWIVMSRILQVRNQWVEGSNEIWLIEKGVRITIRFFIDGGKISMANAFRGNSDKIIGEVINLLP